LKIEVGSKTTTFNKQGEVENIIEKPSYLILDDGRKIELTKKQAQELGIGNDEH
jgi:hypothetical protein